jgi:hypothetical protein
VKAPQSNTDKAADWIVNNSQAQQRLCEQAEFDAYTFPDEQTPHSQTHHSATDEAADWIADIFQA